jgi:SNF2 family DNA or RNA helicase
MLVSHKHQKLILNLREPGRVMTVIPSAKIIQWRGRQLVAVPHTNDHVRVLRNIGLDAPSPMGHYYDWPGMHTPFSHQKITSEYLISNPRCFVLNGLGSGKTLSVLWAFDYLRREKIVRKMLVVSPLSTLERAWGDEIYKNFPHLNFHVLHGTRGKRHKLIGTDADIYIINHDGFKNLDTLKLLCQKEGIDVVAIDEIASFRNAQTDRWKMLNALVNGNAKVARVPKTWVWGLTGTPTPNAPTDVWAQVRLINPRGVPRAWTEFRDMVMMQMGPFKWVARPGAIDIVQRVTQPAIRYATRDCIDLPPTTYVTREAALTPEQQHAFNEMLTLFRTEYDGGAITAINAAVKLGKLLQICCGVAYGKDGQEIHIPALPRVALVKELIDQAEGKALVFVPLTAPLLMVHDELVKEYGTSHVALVHGDTTRITRDLIFRDFQNPRHPLRVICANPGTLSHGLTLTEADLIAWYAPIHSNETYQQANGRIVRPGQRRHTIIANIEATDVERRVYAALQGKQRMQDVFLDAVRDAR